HVDPFLENVFGRSRGYLVELLANVLADALGSVAGPEGARREGALTPQKSYQIISEQRHLQSLRLAPTSSLFSCELWQNCTSDSSPMGAARECRRNRCKFALERTTWTSWEVAAPSKLPFRGRSNGGRTS